MKHLTVQIQEVEDRVNLLADSAMTFRVLIPDGTKFYCYHSNDFGVFWKYFEDSNSIFVVA